MVSEEELEELIREREAAAWKRGFLHNNPHAYWADALNPYKQ